MNKKEITIRESKEDDSNALRQLFFNSRVSAFHRADPSQFELSDFDEETKDEFILAAFADEILIGFASVWVADHFIHHLYVGEKFQYQGVGTRLLQAVKDRFGLPISLKCEESNVMAVRFYKQKGFIEKGSGQSKTGAYILFELNKEIKSTNRF